MLAEHTKHFIQVHEDYWDAIIPSREDVVWMVEYPFHYSFLYTLVFDLRKICSYERSFYESLWPFLANNSRTGLCYYISRSSELYLMTLQGIRRPEGLVVVPHTADENGRVLCSD
jgi:hypothetical protein